MGGEADSYIKETVTRDYNSQGQVDLPPICFTFQTNYPHTSSLSLARPPGPDIWPRKFWLLTSLTVGADFNLIDQERHPPQTFRNCQMSFQTADT